MDNAKIYHMILHEIKNSVTFIDSSLQLLQKKHPEISSFDFWEDSIHELSHLQHLLADLSLNRSFDALHLEPISLPAALSSAISSFYNAVLDGDLQIHTHCPDDIDTILADPLCLHLALTNLIKNACEAMHGKGIITITASRKDQDLILTIADNGPGIAKENIEKIFDPFFTTKTEGTGLGLQVVRQIIDGHHGTISVSLNDPHGCIFQIILPSAIQK